MLTVTTSGTTSASDPLAGVSEQELAQVFAPEIAGGAADHDAVTETAYTAPFTNFAPIAGAGDQPF